MGEPRQDCTVAGVALQGCILNASGVMCTTGEELQSLRDCDDCAAVVTKSCTRFEWGGNVPPRCWSTNGCWTTGYSTELASINSMGLPNKGVEFYIDQCRTYGHTKPHILSVCGLSLDDNLVLVRSCSDVGQIELCEVNFSCPNLDGKAQLGYNFELASEHARKISEIMGQKKWGMKLPPYFDDTQFDNITGIVNEYRPDFITCINSIGNGLMVDVDSETTKTYPRGGRGGIGGSIILPTALANVRTLRNRIHTSVDIMGCGGVMCGADVFKHILCGASAVQVGTLLMHTGISCFATLKQQLSALMVKKNYTKLSDFRGKLQLCAPEPLSQ